MVHPHNGLFTYPVIQYYINNKAKIYDKILRKDLDINLHTVNEEIDRKKD